MNDLELEITSKAYNDIEIISDYIAKDNKTLRILRVLTTYQDICSIF